MFDSTNRAREALKVYAKNEYGADLQSSPDYNTAIQDLISDLLHAAKWEGDARTPQKMLFSALANYEAEIEERKEAP